MTIRTDVTDLTGTPRELADLTGEEMRALRALADAGMIAPLAAAAPTGGALATASAGAAPRKAAPRKAAPQKAAPPKAGGARTGKARSREVQGTLMAALRSGVVEEIH
jgi:hypothetical protein